MNGISNIELERFRSGDVLLFDYSQCAGFSLIAWVIRRVQKRLLFDLGGQVYPGQYKDAFVYSHAALAGDTAILEMTSPRARVMPYADIPAGTIIKVRRPRHEGEDINGVYAGRIVTFSFGDSIMVIGVQELNWVISNFKDLTAKDRNRIEELLEKRIFELTEHGNISIYI